MPGGDMVKIINRQSAFGQGYIYGNPQMTHWKATYRKNSNFAMIPRIITNMNTSPSFGATVTYTLSKDNSDLLYKVHLDATLPTPASSTNSYTSFPGEKLIEYAELRIGGTSISGQLTSDFIHCWHELTIPEEQKWSYRELVGNTFSCVGTISTDKSDATDISVPIPFWFTKNPGVALPICALKNNDVQIVVKYQASTKMVRNANPASTVGTISGSLSNVNLYGTFVYLDQDERLRFQNSRMDYIIEQVQSQTSTMSATVDFNFDHHVKELIWFATRNVFVNFNEHFKYTSTHNGGTNGTTWRQTYNFMNEEQIVPLYTNSSDIEITTCQLKFDNSNLFSDGAKNTRYFTQVQPMYHHTSVPWTPGIFVYSFALKPEEFQPSGTLDFSPITTQQLVITCGSSNYNNVTIMAVNYNVLVIANGHGHLNIST